MKNNKINISLIIAVYNAQEYIENCIKSCLLLKDITYEIIIINDGSTDNTPNICNKLKNEYNNIKVIHQKNKGVSAARNVGIINSKGEWLFFIDADDTINSEELKEVLISLSNQTEDFSICTFGSNFIFKEKNRIETHNVNNQIYDSYLFLNSALFQLASWNYIFKRNLILSKHIFFPEGIICTEDQNFNLKSLCCCNKIISINNIVYNYNCSNPNSVSQRFHTSEWIKSRLKSANDLLSFCQKKSIKTTCVINQVKRLYESYINDNTTNISYSAKKLFFKEEYKNTISMLPSFNKIIKLYIYNFCYELGYILFYLHTKYKLLKESK